MNEVKKEKWDSTPYPFITSCEYVSFGVLVAGFTVLLSIYMCWTPYLIDLLTFSKTGTLVKCYWNSIPKKTER